METTAVHRSVNGLLHNNAGGHESMSDMKHLLALVPLFVGALGCPLQLQAQSQNQPGTNLTGIAILNGLKAKQGEELHDFITFLDYTLDRSRLSDEEIDAALPNLKAVYT